jgi:hypothetical protein
VDPALTKAIEDARKTAVTDKNAEEGAKYDYEKKIAPAEQAVGFLEATRLPFEAKEREFRAIEQSIPELEVARHNALNNFERSNPPNPALELEFNRADQALKDAIGKGLRTGIELKPLRDAFEKAQADVRKFAKERDDAKAAYDKAAEKRKTSEADLATAEANQCKAAPASCVGGKPLPNPPPGAPPAGPDPNAPTAETEKEFCKANAQLCENGKVKPENRCKVPGACKEPYKVPGRVPVLCENDPECMKDLEAQTCRAKPQLCTADGKLTPAGQCTEFPWTCKDGKPISPAGGPPAQHAGAEPGTPEHMIVGPGTGEQGNACTFIDGTCPAGTSGDNAGKPVEPGAGTPRSPAGGPSAPTGPVPCPDEPDPARPECDAPAMPGTEPGPVEPDEGTHGDQGATGSQGGDQGGDQGATGGQGGQGGGQGDGDEGGQGGDGGDGDDGDAGNGGENGEDGDEDDKGGDQGEGEGEGEGN